METDDLRRSCSQDKAMDIVERVIGDRQKLDAETRKKCQDIDRRG